MLDTSVGVRADRGLYAYSQSARKWSIHKHGDTLPLLFARPIVTLLSSEHHRRLTSTKLFCLQAHVCEQLTYTVSQKSSHL